MITLVKASFVIGFERGDHLIIPNGEIAYRDRDIIFVGRDFEGTAHKVIEVLKRDTKSLFPPSFAVA